MFYVTGFCLTLFHDQRFVVNKVDFFGRDSAGNEVQLGTIRLHGDGELQEGQIWEAAMFAGAKGVDNLISTIDFNNQQIDGTTTQVMDLGDLKAKFESFMWKVVVIENGNDMQQVIDGMASAKNLAGKGSPVVVILKTEMGYGVDFMQGTNKFHGAVVSADDLPKALAQLPETELGDF